MKCSLKLQDAKWPMRNLTQVFIVSLELGPEAAGM